MAEEQSKMDGEKFKETLNEAMNYKSADLKRQRVKYDKYPIYIQHSLFYHDSIHTAIL